MFSSPGYLVHLHGSLRPLQHDGVGFLQPLGHGFLEPLVEIAQGQRPIPVDEDTSFSQCAVTAQGYHLTRKKLPREAHGKEKPLLGGEVPINPSQKWA